MADLTGPILITGARGMLGSELVPLLCNHLPPTELVAVDIDELDITAEADVREKVAAISPAAIINCAAYTNVDGCEAERDLAFRINADGPGLLARAAAEAGAVLVHLSTDFVFAGPKGEPYVADDAPNPTSAYGES